jgi:NADH-quinone oxidoreductase subunit N
LEIGGWQSLRYLGPVLALSVTAAAIVLLARIRRLDRVELGELAILGAAVSVFLAARLKGWGEVWILERALIVDDFAIFFILVLGIAIVAILWISVESPPPASRDHGWACALILIVAIGLELMASAANLWMGYLAVELASLGLWTLFLAQGSGAPSRAQCAAAAVSSLAMLCGVTWLAGFARSADYELMHAGLADLGSSGRGSLGLAVAVGVVLLAFPSRVLVAAWGRGDRESPALDALVAVGCAAAGLAFSMRLLLPVLSTRAAAGHWAEQPGPDWTWLAGTCAVAAMTIGNLGALRERSMHRLLTATAVAHVGYALLAVSSATDAGLEGALFYVVAFGLSALGAFHIAALVERARGSDDLAACRGLLRSSGWPVGVGLAVFLLSLAGVPGLVGFPAKLHVMRAAVAHAFDAFASLALFNWGLGFVATWRVVRRMLERADAPGAVRLRAYDACFVASLVAAAVGLGVHEGPLLDLVRRSAILLPR